MLGILLEPGKDLSLLGCHEVGHGAEERRGNGLVPIILALPLPGSAQIGGDLARDALFADTITLEGQAQKGDSLFGRWRPGMAELAENRRALELFSLGNVRYEASLRFGCLPEAQDVARAGPGIELPLAEQTLKHGGVQQVGALRSSPNGQGYLHGNKRSRVSLDGSEQAKRGPRSNQLAESA